MKKKIILSIAIVMCLVITAVFTSCGSVYDYSDLSEYITVGNYKGLEYDKTKLNVTDDEIKQEIDNAVAQSAKTEDVTSGKVENGDTVIIDFTGKVDGKEFEGGTAQDTQLVIGSGQFIEGFESGLIGKNVGDSVSLDLKFPDKYQKEELAGKPVTFDVTIKKKQVTSTPEYNEQWIKENTSYTTKEEYEKFTKEKLVKDKKIQVGTELISSLAEKAEIKDYPEKELKLIVQSFKEQLHNQADQSGTAFEDMIKQYGLNTEEELDKALSDQGKTQEAQEMVAYSIAKTENLVATSSDIDKYYEDLLKDNNLTEDKFEENMGMSLSEYKSEHDIDLQKALTSQNVAIFLVDNGNGK